MIFLAFIHVQALSMMYYSFGHLFPTSTPNGGLDNNYFKMEDN